MGVKAQLSSVNDLMTGKVHNRRSSLVYGTAFWDMSAVSFIWLFCTVLLISWTESSYRRRARRRVILHLISVMDTRLCTMSDFELLRHSLLGVLWIVCSRCCWRCRIGRSSEKLDLTSHQTSLRVALRN